MNPLTRFLGAGVWMHGDHVLDIVRELVAAQKERYKDFDFWRGKPEAFVGALTTTVADRLFVNVAKTRYLLTKLESRGLLIAHRTRGGIRWYPTPPDLKREPTEDEKMGMAWWNGLNQFERASVLRQVPDSCVATAWRLWKTNRISVSQPHRVYGLDAGRRASPSRNPGSCSPWMPQQLTRGN